MNKIAVSLNSNMTPIGVSMDADVAKKIAVFINEFKCDNNNPTKSTIGQAILNQFATAPMVTNYVVFYELVTKKIKELE